MRGRPRILQRAATSQGGAWSGRHLGRHGLEDVRAARVLHRHTMAQGAHAAASRHAERSPRSLKMGRASVTGCPSAASRSSQVSVSHVADGHGRRGCQSALTAGRGATAELRQRATGWQGGAVSPIDDRVSVLQATGGGRGDAARIKNECNLRVSTRPSLQMQTRLRCTAAVSVGRVGIGCHRDGCLHAAARFARVVVCDEKRRMVVV